MQINNVENNNYQSAKKGSNVGYVASSMITDAVLGAGFGYIMPYIFKVRSDEFSAKAVDILEKSNEVELKEAVKNGTHSLENLLESNNKDKKAFEKSFGEGSKILSGFKNVLSKYKQSTALRQAGLGAALCGAIGLVMGVINLNVRNKVNKKVAANQQTEG